MSPDPYRIALSADVASFVATFDAQDLHYWNVSLAEMASDPSARFGSYSERIIPIPGVTRRTYIYWITEHTTISGEHIFVFTAEYFDYRLVYVVDEEGREVEVFSVRPAWVYDPPP